MRVTPAQITILKFRIEMYMYMERRTAQTYITNLIKQLTSLL